jgi:putative redox protein
MATKTAVATLAGDGMRLETVMGSGHTIVLDNTEGDTGARPAELVGAALAGCTAMDVISILRKKRQPVERYEVRVAAEQMDGHPHAFTRFDIVHVVEGDVDPAAIARAIELSATKYCAVGSTLASGAAELHYAYVLRNGGDERYAEVLVTGPNSVPTDVAGTPG